MLAEAETKEKVVRNIGWAETVAYGLSKRSHAFRERALTSFGPPVPSFVLQDKSLAVVLPLTALGNWTGDGVPKVMVTSPKTDAFAVQSDDSPQDTQIVAMVDVKLYSKDNEPVHVQGLTEPIIMYLPVNESSPVTDMFYWDEERQAWSGEGMQVLSISPREVVFKTTHLTIFAAIWQGFIQTLACAQFGLISAEGLLQVFKGKWYQEPYALLFWTLLCAMIMMLIRARIIDKKMNVAIWEDQYFLLALQTKDQADEQAKEEAKSHERHAENTREEAGSASMTSEAFEVKQSNVSTASGDERVWKESSTQASKSRSGGCCSHGNALRDALDDICSRWFDYFGEMREFLESVWSGTSLSDIDGEHNSHVLLQIIVGALVSSGARRQASTQLGMSSETVNFVLEDKGLKSVLKTASARPKPVSEEPGSKKLLAWMRLHQQVLDEIDRYWGDARHCKTIPSTMMRVFLASHPVASAFFKCKQFPRSFRILLLSCNTLGSFTLAAMFFDGTGMAQNKRVQSQCSDSEEMATLEYLGRILAITFASAIFASIPVSFMSSLHSRSFKKVEYEGSSAWHHQLRVWRVQDRLLWCFAGLYNALCTSYIVLFLANVDTGEIPNWGRSVILQVLQENVIVPLAISVVVPLSTPLLLFCLSRLLRKSRKHILRDQRSSKEGDKGNWQAIIHDI